MERWAGSALSRLEGMSARNFMLASPLTESMALMPRNCASDPGTGMEDGAGAMAVPAASRRCAVATAAMASDIATRSMTSDEGISLIIESVRFGGTLTDGGG
ncbi:hypothetical protein GCM10025760_25710 [Microbacterium yannicii]|uniref:Uncharacterized protein n=1 Tax=Microbacterium yannicii TaxID=671622 RepID=A0ABP9MC33_9MICO